jgi:hypothetical protein
MRLASTVLVLTCGGAILSCAGPPQTASAPTAIASGADPAIAAFVANIRAVDNHSHANSVAPGDTDYDALPLDGIVPFDLPATLRPEHPAWLGAFHALYQYPHADLSEAHVADLRTANQQVAKTQGGKFPEWVLDQVGTDVMLANRIAMGPGLAPPRFRWVSYADPLLYPLATSSEARTTPDREKLFPLEEKLLRRYLADLKLAKVPPTLDAYLNTVVTPTLEAQQKGGCVAVKYEAAYLRALDFGDAPQAVASKVYATYVGGGTPPHADYTALQDFLFRYIAREAGRLGMAVHIHAFEGVGNYYDVAGADPALLEPVLNDPALRQTQFVIVHGGGINAAHAGALLWKPNVFVDMSLMTLAYPTPRLAGILKAWIEQFPDKVLFGSDASALGPDMGWEIAAWIGTTNGRTALSIALSDMLRSGDITRARAQEVATMVMRGNASRLYKLGLN